MNGNARILLVATLLVTGCGEQIQSSVLNVRAMAVSLLCEEISARFPAGDVVLVLNPVGRDQTNVRALQDETVAYFHDALPGRTLRKAEPVLINGLAASDWSSRIRPGSSAPLSYMMEPNAFEMIAREHPNATVLVSLVGMPDPGAFTNIPSAVLLLPDLRVFGTPARAIEAFRRGLIHAAAVVVNGSVVLITESNAGNVIPTLDW